LNKPHPDTVGAILFLLVIFALITWSANQQKEKDRIASATYAAYKTTSPKHDPLYNPNAKHEAQADRDATEWALELVESKVESLCLAGCTVSKPGCVIKGNISTSGEKIYHLPSDKYYTETVINPPYGERWFCTTEDAEAMGWRRAKK
jgi:hypothetical protein